MYKPAAHFDQRSVDLVTPTERVIAALWNEVLGTDVRPGPSCNFFEQGGDVMSAAQLELRIEDELPVVLRPGTIRGAPTLRLLSSSVDQQMAACRADYLLLMAEPQPEGFEQLVENGMPGTPGILGDPEFAARAIAAAQSCSAKRKRGPRGG